MPTYSVDPAVSGPRHDGSRSLARESRYGQVVSFVAGVVALGLAGYLAELDLSTLPGWLTGAATLAVSTAVGTLTSWATRNRARALDIRGRHRPEE